MLGNFVLFFKKKILNVNVVLHEMSAICNRNVVVVWFMDTEDYFYVLIC